MSGAIYIAVTATGDVDDALMSAVAGGVEAMFGLPARMAPVLGDVKFALDPERMQYHSTAILGELAEKAPADCLKVLCITDVDLFIPILTFVHGEAQLGGKACIISTHRLKEMGPGVTGHDAYISRVVKEAVHELCHTFDLRHCREPDCVMRFCRNAEEVDGRPKELCRYCRILMGDAMKRENLEWPLDQTGEAAG